MEAAGGQVATAAVVLRTAEVTNHRFPFRYSRLFIGRARTKS